jgi:hypothetical protein
VNYGLVEPFDIDRGELDGLTPQECFTLGVEWEMFRARLESGEAFVTQVHTANAQRLLAMCRRKGRAVTDHWLHEDYPDWRVLKVSEATPAAS